MIVIYGNLKTCGKCKMVHKKLIDKNIKFEFIDDEDAVMIAAQKIGVMGIPFALIDKIPYNTTELIKYILTL